MAKGAKAPSLPTTTEKDYQAEDDFRTMERHAELKSNPKRLGAAMNMGRKKMATMSKAMGSMKGGKKKKGMKVKF